MSTSTPDPDEQRALEILEAALADSPAGERARIIKSFVLAAMGAIPWVGGFLGAMASIKSDEDKSRTRNIQIQWLEEHSTKINSLHQTLAEVIRRFESLGEQIDERIQSEEYLNLVRKAFRVWDRSDTEEKRSTIRNLIANAAGTRVCSDDVVRLFIDWLAAYHEAHLAVIRHIYSHRGTTRYDIWTAVYGDVPREDSAEADLFRLLIRDLSTGGVIRQARDTDYDGRFLRREGPTKRAKGSRVTESSFENTKPYVLTELGSQFVHYALTESTRRIEAATTPDPT